MLLCPVFTVLQEYTGTSISVRVLLISTGPRRVELALVLRELAHTRLIPRGRLIVLRSAVVLKSATARQELCHIASSDFGRLVSVHLLPGLLLSIVVVRFAHPGPSLLYLVAI